MTESRLSHLYRSSTQPQTLSARALIDAETAVRAAQGRVVPHERDEVAAALAGSSAHADLVQFLRALEPASAELAQGLARSATHESRERRRSSAHRRMPQRGWQWSAVAASLVAVIALFVMRDAGRPHGTLQAQLPHSPRADAIFDGGLDAAVAGHAADDRIFHTSGGDEVTQDRIFSARSDG
jgi:hypothetical protein